MYGQSFYGIPPVGFVAPYPAGYYGEGYRVPVAPRGVWLGQGVVCEQPRYYYPASGYGCR